MIDHRIFFIWHVKCIYIQIDNNYALDSKEKIMNIKGLTKIIGVFAVVLFSYTLASAQIVDKVADATKDAAKKTVEVTKDVAGKTADVTVDAAKKTGEVSKDVYETAEDKTVDAAKATGKGAKKIGKYTVETTGDVAGAAYEGGKWFVVTTWDGTKWVSKRTWYATKKTGTAIKAAYTGDSQKP